MFVNRSFVDWSTRLEKCCLSNPSTPNTLVEEMFQEKLILLSCQANKTIKTLYPVFYFLIDTVFAPSICLR